MMKTMKYIPFIVAVWALLAVTACTTDDMESSSKEYPMDGDVVTVMGRITRFKDYEVNSRGAKQGDEGKITSMALAIFPVTEDGTSLAEDGCVYYNYSANGGELLFTIDRSSDEFNFEQNRRYAMYVFANIPGMSSFVIGTSLDDMLKVTTDVTGLDIPTNGFPMMGSLGDTFSTTFEKDGQTFVLSPTVNDELVAPLVDGQSQNLLTIPMKAMYAKMNFTIAVRPDQTVEGNYSPEFTLSSYTVCEIPTTVDCNNATNGTEVIESFNGLPISGNLSASGANTINFSFYLPEQLLTPATSSAGYTYPFGKGSELREEDKVYRQRFKSELLDDTQKATHIVLSGRYRDHQNHYYDVDYTIYLGKDNYEDFNIERNGEYNNSITIRGILNSDDASNNKDAISIDHRVNVERTQPAIISLRREVLLDSHFEVRPLRIRSSGIGADDINAVKVEVLDPATTDWMRIERSFGGGTAAGSPTNGNNESIYIDEDSNDASYGKRRYFTYNLVNGLATDGTTQDTSGSSLVYSTEVIVPLDEGGDCVWIYVDECLETGDEVRSGVIKVTYGTNTSGTFVATTDAAFPPVEYTISQRKLFQVTYDTRTYNIEYQEEYLHNFDADEEYGQTEYEGMTWGAENVQFSSKYPAVYVDLNGGIMDWLDRIGIELNDVTNNIIAGVRPYYDFYLTRDKNDLGLIEDSDISDGAWNGIVVRNYSGYTFSKEIITMLIAEKKISGGTLSSTPQSAVEYCYNKNKRDMNGTVSNVEWYLPAIDEIEEIVTSQYVLDEKSYDTYARFHEFQEKFYWSSQPAYIYNNLSLTIKMNVWIPIVGTTNITLGTAGGKLFVDNIGDSQSNDPGSARATRVSYNNGQYEPVKSGLSDYVYTISYTQQDGNLNDPTYTINSPLPEPDDGYKARNSMARVRCVRKLQ